jgi:hypothetical protein
MSVQLASGQAVVCEHALVVRVVNWSKTRQWGSARAYRVSGLATMFAAI